MAAMYALRLKGEGPATTYALIPAANKAEAHYTATKHYATYLAIDGMELVEATDLARKAA